MLSADRPSFVSLYSRAFCLLRFLSPMTESDKRRPLEEDICIHIFTVSSAMVGVCLTVIGLLRVVITIRKIDTLADDFLAFDAVLFLISCLSSYWAMRTKSHRRMHRVEWFADRI